MEMIAPQSLTVEYKWSLGSSVVQLMRTVRYTPVEDTVLYQLYRDGAENDSILGLASEIDSAEDGSTLEAGTTHDFELVAQSNLNMELEPSQRSAVSRAIVPLRESAMPSDLVAHAAVKSVQRVYVDKYESPRLCVGWGGLFDGEPSEYWHEIIAGGGVVLPLSREGTLTGVAINNISQDVKIRLHVRFVGGGKYSTVLDVRVNDHGS